MVICIKCIYLAIILWNYNKSLLFCVEISLKNHIAQYYPVFPVSGSIAQPVKTLVFPPSKTRAGYTLPTLPPIHVNVAEYVILALLIVEGCTVTLSCYFFVIWCLVESCLIDNQFHICFILYRLIVVIDSYIFASSRLTKMYGNISLP